eukprot:SAG11_NODE_2074_length_3858_cov_4.261772_1_plen_772_part_00
MTIMALFSAMVWGFMPFAYGQAGCSLGEFYEVADIVDLCCESAPGGTCGDAFPATCSQSCAAILVPFMNQCSTFATTFPDDTFPEFHLQQLVDFVPACRQVHLLYERGSREGSPCARTHDEVEGLPSLVERMNEACCAQEGENVCNSAEGPTACDAECAEVFLPFFSTCMSGPSADGLSAEMEMFIQLNERCTEELPAADVAIMLSNVEAFSENPNCFINTSAIITRTDAKDGAHAICAEDQLPICAAAITAGQMTCRDDFCAFCPDAHNCDHTCELPCGTSVPGTAPAAACENDAYPICARAIAAGIQTCDATFCPTCLEAHSCDATCQFPCGADGGGHRLLTEGVVPVPSNVSAIGSSISIVSPFSQTPACRDDRTWSSADGLGCVAYAAGGANHDYCEEDGASTRCPAACGLCVQQCHWDDFDDALLRVASTCCPADDPTCQLGMPGDCPYACGTVVRPFVSACHDLILAVLGAQRSTGFALFNDKCLELDPTSLARTLHDAVCVICGDGLVTGSEQCDEGGANSERPGAACRTNCMRARCGDGVVDRDGAPGWSPEECDEGPLNSQTPGASCRLNCHSARCGDGVVDRGEECDGTAGCSADCRQLGPCEYPKRVECGRHGSCYSGLCRCTDDYTGESCEVAPRLPCCSTVTLHANGQPIAGTINDGGIANRNALVTTAGMTYDITVTLDSLFDSVVEVYDMDGATILDSNDDDGSGGLGSHLVWTAPSTGEYYVDVRGYSQSQRGSYTLTIATTDNSIEEARCNQSC